MTPSDATKDQARSAEYVTNADEPRESAGEYVDLFGYITYHSDVEAHLYQGLGVTQYYAIPKSDVVDVKRGFSEQNPCLAQVKVRSQLRITYVSGDRRATLPAGALADVVAAQNKKGESASSTGPCRPGCGSTAGCYCAEPDCWFELDAAIALKLGVILLDKSAQSK